MVTHSSALKISTLGLWRAVENQYYYEGNRT